MRRLILPVLVYGGGPAMDPSANGSDRDLTSRTGVARHVEWDGFVYVPPDADAREACAGR